MSMLAPSTQSGNQREIEVQFTGENMTPWGGVGLLRKFVHKLAVEKAWLVTSPPRTGIASTTLPGSC